MAGSAISSRSGATTCRPTTPRDAAGQTIVATVHVEASWAEDDCLGETRWLEGLDKPGGVARPLCRPCPARFAGPRTTLIEAQAAFPRVVGIRDILSWTPDPARRFAARGDLMDDPDWRAGLTGSGATV